MKIIADTHTHTVATDHAYSTLLENIDYAKRAGMQAIAMTEHAPLLPDSPMVWHHHSIVSSLPQVCEGITLIKGIELNAVNEDGLLEVEPALLKRLQWVILSFHNTVMPLGMGKDYYTAVYEAYANCPYIDCIGHCGDPRFEFDYGKVIPLFGKNGKAVEINNHSFPGRPGSDVNCKKIALLCKEHNVPITVSSDSHFAPMIGHFPYALAMLEEIGFPERLVLNADMDRLVSFINSKEHKTNKILRSE